MPRRRSPDPGETACALPGNLSAPQVQVDCVREELERIGTVLSGLAVGLVSFSIARFFVGIIIEI